MAAPEKLNLWDRFFNRYRKEVIDEGSESWYRLHHVGLIFMEREENFCRDYVKYRIIDRLTGSETIKKEYLN